MKILSRSHASCKVVNLSQNFCLINTSGCRAKDQTTSKNYRFNVTGFALLGDYEYVGAFVYV